MATIKLKNIRTGESKNYPLAFIDATVDPSIIIDKTAAEAMWIGYPAEAIDPFYASRPASELKVYKINTDNAHRFLSDVITPVSADNLIHIPLNTTLKDIFSPALDESGITYSVPPSGYGTNNPLGTYWQNAKSGSTDIIIDDVHMPTASTTWSPTVPLWSSSVAAQSFETVNHSYFGACVSFCGLSGSTYKLGVIVNGAKQMMLGQSAEGNCYAAYAGTDWSLSSTDGQITACSNPYERVGSWYQLDPDPLKTAAEQLCPTERISTQMCYVEMSGVPYVGAGVIFWNYDDFGNLRPYHLCVTLYPLWLMGGVAGEFTPDIPVVDEIPASTTTITNGTWNIVQSAAGAASIPSVSPLAGIGTTEAGMHILIADAVGIKKISDKAWNTITASQLESFTSGLMSCGFIPYEFIKNIMIPANAVTDCVIGKVKIAMPSDGNTHMWIANSQIFSQILAATFEISLREVYANYLDFEPYTSVSIEIPFCGEIPIPASACIGGQIEVIMNCNITNGDVVATINCISSNHILDGTMTPTTPLLRTFFAYGNCFAQMPIVGTNSGLSQFLSGSLQTLSGVANLALGNPAGLGELGSGAVSMFEAGLQPVTGASPIGSPALIGNKKVILKIKRPSPDYVQANIGYQPYTLEKKCKLKDLKQSVNDDWHIAGKDLVVVREMAIPDAGLTSSEKEMISQILQGGVFV